MNIWIYYIMNNTSKHIETPYLKITVIFILKVIIFIAYNKK